MEGIGIMRATNNFLHAHIDDAMVVSDQEAVEMAYYLLRCWPLRQHYLG